MSAAALSAHRQPSEPDSMQSRNKRDWSHYIPSSVCGRPAGNDTIRGRAKHRLPCEP